MSNSKFLPFQDANGDGLNDACKEEFVVTESKVCPECTPNPKLIVTGKHLELDIIFL